MFYPILRRSSLSRRISFFQKPPPLSSPPPSLAPDRVLSSPVPRRRCRAQSSSPPPTALPADPVTSSALDLPPIALPVVPVVGLALGRPHRHSNLRPRLVTPLLQPPAALPRALSTIDVVDFLDNDSRGEIKFCDFYYLFSVAFFH
jgi:hypothetical protein